jgi:plasmid stabilization system protein ParE
MSHRLEIAAKAERDISSQHEWYCKNAGEEVADRYVAAVREATYRLKTQPGLGSSRKFKRRGLARIRAIRVDRPFDVHLVFYRCDETTVTVEYVKHGALDLPKHLREVEAIYGIASATTVTAQP